MKVKKLKYIDKKLKIILKPMLSGEQSVVAKLKEIKISSLETRCAQLRAIASKIVVFSALPLIGCGIILLTRDVEVELVNQVFHKWASGSHALESLDSALMSAACLFGLILSLAGLVAILTLTVNKLLYILSGNQKKIYNIRNNCLEELGYTPSKKNLGKITARLKKHGLIPLGDRTYCHNGYTNSSDHQFELEHVLIEKKEIKKDSHGRKQISYREIFRSCLVFIPNFNIQKDISLVLNSNHHSKFRQSLSKLNKYRTEFLEFERRYQVYSSDSHFAMKYIDPTVAEKYTEIFEYFKLFNHVVSYAFYPEGLYLSVPNLDLNFHFDLLLFKKAKDQSNLKQFLVESYLSHLIIPHQVLYFTKQCAKDSLNKTIAA